MLFLIRWMNGQHLRALPSEEFKKLIGEQWKKTGILTESEGPFVDVRLVFSALSIASVEFFFFST